VRRDYLTVVQKGKTSDKTVDPSDLPAKTAAVEGIVWLPRLIAKARAKLRVRWTRTPCMAVEVTAPSSASTIFILLICCE